MRNVVTVATAAPRLEVLILVFAPKELAMKATTAPTGTTDVGTTAAIMAGLMPAVTLRADMEPDKT